MTSFFRYCFITSLCGISFAAKAQQNTIVKYYDSSWVATTQDSAFYVTNFVKKADRYECTSYWIKSNKLNCISFTNDTLFSKVTGLLRRYYENGHLKDSSFYANPTGELTNSYRYYESGKIWAHYIAGEGNRKESQEGYAEDGKPIKNFIVGREATFEGGMPVWIRYLQKNLKSETAEKNGARAGTYQVIVRFIVNKNGTISDVRAETKWGFGMEQEVVRVIKNSPKWIPAIEMNEKINAYRRQPLTFVVEENK